jgi:cyclopropane-fatty-acyl-phospholipid synthase
MTASARLRGDDLARRLCFRLFSNIADERIEVLQDGRRFAFGPPEASLRAQVTVHDPGVWRGLLRGSTGMAETYMAGDWDADDLLALIRIGARNMRGLDRARQRWRSVLAPAQRLGRLVPENDLLGAKRNISAHYDLGNDLFSLFLDPSMMYSCAYFETPQATLAEAQEAKLERICRALDLGPEDHLLEIGTGWGALAVHAAGRYGCRVTTTTISTEQHRLASDRIRAAGLEDRVEVLLEDYRDLTGRYDKLLSIEMIEAVGWQYFPEYFRRCSELLTPDGLMLLQAITIDDRAYEGEKNSRSFINKYIFPGGCLPSLEVIGREIARETDMQTVWLDDITEHYGETLSRWRTGFNASEDRAADMGYDLSFRRMWELYLCYVEAGFRERRIGDVQMLFAKPEWRGELGAGQRAGAAAELTTAALG